jgi:hypothetical protein
MKSIAFGALRFDRHSIPPELKHVDEWPRVDDSALSESGRDIFNRRIRAMTLFLGENTPLREITRETGLGFNDLYRTFERCVTTHEDGRIFGCRALIPYQHTKSYGRCARVDKRRIWAAAAALSGHCSLARAEDCRAKSGARRVG